MELVLTLEGGGAVADRQRRLHQGRLSIGRSADNDWVLPDPERVLSRHHCLVERRGEDWLLTDTSSNGVFVHGSPIALGPGRSVQLRDGLRVRLGDYVLVVRLTQETDTTSPATGASAEPASELSDRFRLLGKPPSGSLDMMFGIPAETGSAAGYGG